jgi:hypothetical protein
LDLRFFKDGPEMLVGHTDMHMFRFFVYSSSWLMMQYKVSHIDFVWCHNPKLELVTKVKAWKGAYWECNPWITFTLLGVWKSVKEWAHTLPSGLAFWELESLQSPKSLESNFKSQKSLDWRVPYAIEKILRLRCLKWAYITHLNT